MSNKYKKANIGAMAEAIYQAQCDYVGANHPAKCVEILTDALQSFEDEVLDAYQQNEALLAQVEELHEAAFSVGILLNTILNDPDVCGETKLGVVNWFTANPQQSLDSLKASIEQETIYGVVNYLRDVDELSYPDLIKTLHAIRNIPRKYPSKADKGEEK